MNTTTSTNDYWDAVRGRLTTDRLSGSAAPVVDAYGISDRDYREHLNRNELCSRFSWTITDPATVEFVRDHCGPFVVDPMAGSGWWAYLLGQDGVDVLASDANPPGSDGNHWHKHDTHVQLLHLDAAEAVEQAGAGCTLLLSWPPYDTDDGWRALNAFRGNHLIFIGEGWGGCTGDDDLFRLIESDWTETAEHRPVQYIGLHDYVTVYERKDKN